jgi:transcriptional regulator with XRE-family HTH domain
MNLGDKIKLIRYKHNLSQEELSKMLDINRNYLSRIETNKSLPDAEILVKLANHFDISIDTLLGIDIEFYTEENKIEKIKKINQVCSKLSNKDLDFLLNLLSVMEKDSK